MLEGVVPCNLSHRRGVAALCILFKIYFREDHPLGVFLLELFVPVTATRRVDALHQHALVPTHSRTGQYSRSFFPACAELWNALMVLYLLMMVLTALNNLSIGIFPFEGGFCFLLFFFSPFFAGRVVSGICGSHGAFALPARSALPVYFNNNNNLKQKSTTKV